MTKKHLTEDLIAAYAAGTCGEGVALAVSAHLTFCPQCRADVAAREALFASLLPSEGARADAPNDALMALLDEDAPEIERPVAANLSAGPLPRAVAERIGVDFEAISWKFRLPGVSEYEFINEEGETVSLLRVKPGASIPQHTHEAEEMTVVLAGILEDEGGEFGVGDIALADGDTDHHPRAGGDEPCICLAVLTGGVTFTGRFGRALNLFT